MSRTPALRHLHLSIVLDDRVRDERRSRELRASRHPSESPRQLAARTLAFALEPGEGLAFPPGGLSARGVPTLWAHDASGRRTAWIEVGAPGPSRLRRAVRSGGRVAVYATHDHAGVRRRLAALRAPRGAELWLYRLDPAALDRLAAALPSRGRLEVVREPERLRLCTPSGELEAAFDEERLTP